MKKFIFYLIVLFFINLFSSCQDSFEKENVTKFYNAENSESMEMVNLSNSNLNNFFGDLRKIAETTYSTTTKEPLPSLSCMDHLSIYQNRNGCEDNFSLCRDCDNRNCCACLYDFASCFGYYQVHSACKLVENSSISSTCENLCYLGGCLIYPICCPILCIYNHSFCLCEGCIMGCCTYCAEKIKGKQDEIILVRSLNPNALNNYNDNLKSNLLDHLEKFNNENSSLNVEDLQTSNTAIQELISETKSFLKSMSKELSDLEHDDRFNKGSEDQIRGRKKRIRSTNNYIKFLNKKISIFELILSINNFIITSLNSNTAVSLDEEQKSAISDFIAYFNAYIFEISRNRITDLSQIKGSPFEVISQEPRGTSEMTAQPPVNLEELYNALILQLNGFKVNEVP